MIPTIPHPKIDHCPNGPSDDLDGIYPIGSKTLGTLVPNEKCEFHSPAKEVSLLQVFLDVTTYESSRMSARGHDLQALSPLWLCLGRFTLSPLRNPLTESPVIFVLSISWFSASIVEIQRWVLINEKLNSSAFFLRRKLSSHWLSKIA